MHQCLRISSNFYGNFCKSRYRIRAINSDPLIFFGYGLIKICNTRPDIAIESSVVEPESAELKLFCGAGAFN